jgi:predicted transcriptional regulator
MTFSEIFTAFMSIMFTIFAARIGVKLARMDEKADARHKEAIACKVLEVKHRAHEATLLVELAEAVRKKKVNGEVKAALDQFKTTHEEYEDFVRIQASTRLAENK